MSFGRALEQLMAERGLSQRELARLAGVDHSLVARVIKEERRPTRSFIEAVAPYVGRRPSDLWAMATDAGAEEVRREDRLAWVMSDLKSFMPGPDEVARFEGWASRPPVRDRLDRVLGRRFRELAPFPWLWEKVLALRAKLAEGGTPPSHAALAAGALLYFLAVLDAVPDFTGLGLLDDAAVLYSAWSSLCRPGLGGGAGNPPPAREASGGSGGGALSV